MTILELCKQLDELDDDAIIFATRLNGEFSLASEAVAIKLTESEIQLPATENAARHCPGLSYCLEVSIAKDAVEVWSSWRNGQHPTARERAEAVCYKANNDAWGPPNSRTET